MQKLWCGSATVCGVALFGLMLVASQNSAEARPQYLKHKTEPEKSFLGMYPDVKEAETLKCGVCHPEKSKKVRNNYGKAIQKALGDKKNEMDADKIAAALKEAEKAPSGTEGKTFGDLLKAGQLPDPPE